MTSSEIYQTLTAIFHDVFMREDIVLTPATSAKDVAGWDSFKQIEILLALEEHYKFKFTTKELDGLQNVGDLVGVVLRRTA